MIKKLLLLLITLTFLHAENIVIVVSKELDVSKLNEVQIKRLFLAKTNRINNVLIKIVELQDTAYKQYFYKKVSGKSKAQLRSYWTTLIFTGKAQPPKQLQNMQELLSIMKEDSRTITYLPVSKITTDMKVLYTIKN